MKQNKGFTLIETLVYLGLLSFLIGGILLSGYELIRASDGTRGKVLVDSEADFIIKKIAWAMNGASAIIEPVPPVSDSTLTVVNDHVSPNPLTFDLLDGTIRLTRGTDEPVPLSTKNVLVSTLNFQNIPPANGRPRALVALFTMNGRSFEFTKYLRIETP